MKLEPLESPAAPVLTQRLPEPAVEIAWASRLNHRGLAERSKAAGTKPAFTTGSNPVAPATYVDDASGASVTEEFWPGDPVPESE